MKKHHTPDMERGRSAEFERSASLETLLAEVNGAIGDVLAAPYERPRYPVILIMGAPRSGTTLTSQWLSALGPFSYPSNLAARFYANPYLGARIQQILVDADHGNQLGLNRSQAFSSALGKTEGALAPSEFWYFWRQFFSFGEIQTLSDAALDAADGAGFLRGLAGLEAAFDKPLVLKGMIMDWHIPYLDSLLDKVVFLNVERDPFYAAQSLYFARERFFSDPTRWYSFKPPEYETLKKQSVPVQLAGQIHYTRSAVAAGLAKVDRARKLTFAYEDFCRDPAKVYAALESRLARQAYGPLPAYDGQQRFDATNTVKLDDQMAAALREALQQFGESCP